MRRSFTARRAVPAALATSPGWGTSKSVRMRSPIEGPSRAIGRKHSQRDHRAREDGQPPRRAHVFAPSRDEQAPFRGWRRGAEAEEAQRGNAQNGPAKLERREHGDRARGVRNDMAPQDAQM